MLQQFESYFPPFKYFLWLSLQGWLNFLSFISQNKFNASKYLPLPAVAACWQDDTVFAEQRLSGVNPVVIRSMIAGDQRAIDLKTSLQPRKQEKLLQEGTKAMCAIAMAAW